MKLFLTKQIAEIDRFTIENEPISDIDLMERAAGQITDWLVKHYSAERKVMVFAGPGNNGGDGLTVARQMADRDFRCEVCLIDMGKDLKGSPAIKMQRLKEQGKVKLHMIREGKDFPVTESSDLLVDGMFGSGLTRPLEGLSATVVHRINELPNTVVAIDIPSGLMGEDNPGNVTDNILKADFTLTFQFPKISFFFAENERFTGKWEVLPIGLHPEGIARTHSDFFYIEKEDVSKIIIPRSKFAHKGIFGHALLIAGAYGKIGAAVMASKSCLRAGTGLLTTHVPGTGYPVIQSTVPEAMASIDAHDFIFSEVPDLMPYSAIGIGPGLGKNHQTKRAFHELIKNATVPLVIDADGLNILSEKKEWLEEINGNAILTPHPGEFSKLAGSSGNSYERMEKQREFAHKYNVIVVLKGAYTTVAIPDGRLFFNSTGNPGMATAGSGDVLTGIILGLLAQGFSLQDAATAGIFLHGMAGDLAVSHKSEMSLIATDITEFFGNAVREVSEFGIHNKNYIFRP
jgi:ADP-dependent NAD(P)H-hydrate dehydratase / NAD(P)H-hydrate epimerase